jgi:hypothetical protein
MTGKFRRWKWAGRLKYRSDALAAAYEAALDLYRLGAINGETMRGVEEICLAGGKRSWV